MQFIKVSVVEGPVAEVLGNKFGCLLLEIHVEKDKVVSILGGLEEAQNDFSLERNGSGFIVLQVG